MQASASTRQAREKIYMNRREFLSLLIPIQVKPPEDICSPEYTSYWQDKIEKQPTTGRLHWYNRVALTMNQMICDIRYVAQHMDLNILDIGAMKASQRIRERADDLKEYSFRLEQAMK